MCCKQAIKFVCLFVSIFLAEMSPSVLLPMHTTVSYQCQYELVHQVEFLYELMLIELICQEVWF